MQLGEDALRQFPADAGHALQVVHAGGLDALESAEGREQGLTALGSDAADLLQHGGRARLAASRSMALDREPVRLVADLLQQVQPRMFRRQPQRRRAIRKDYLLEPGLALGTVV